MKHPYVMDHRFFLGSLIVVGIALLGSMFLAFVFIGVWYWVVK